MSPKPRTSALTPEQAQKFGAKIRQLREQTGLEVPHAARRCLLSDPFWYQLELGGRLVDDQTGERQPVNISPGNLLLIVWQLPVADPTDQAELFTLAGYPQLIRRTISLPRAEDLGGGEDYTEKELQQIQDRAAWLRLGRMERTRRRAGRDVGRDVGRATPAD